MVPSRLVIGGGGVAFVEIDVRLLVMLIAGDAARDIRPGKMV